MKKLFMILMLLCMGFGGEAFAKELPVLMYHSIDDTGGEYSVDEEKLKSDIDSLKEAGYTTILFEDVIGYVYRGESLPEKPVVITFDDGYKNNYEKGLKIAKEKDIKFEMFAIAGFVEYSPLSASWEMAKEMEESGRVSVGAHTFALHAYVPSERIGVERNENESYIQWERLFRKDLMYNEKFMIERLGKKPTAFAYPFGNFCVEAERVLRESDYMVTVTTEPGVNIINIGDLESLYLMMRISMDNRAESAAEVIERYREINTTEQIAECKKHMWDVMYASREDFVSILYRNEDLSKKQINYTYLDSYIDTKYLPAHTRRLMAAAIGDFIITGFPDLTLGAENYITRGEAAVMLARKMRFAPGEVAHRFSDTSSWNEHAISWCAEMGYMIGYGDSFGVDDILTENQLKTIYERLKTGVGKGNTGF